MRAIAEDFFRRGHDNLFLTLEDASYLGCATDDEVLGWGPACVSLTWNYENGLAGGCFSETGLTRRGERAVAMLGERGIALDCAHLNIRSFCDVLDFPAEIVNTHTCMYALHPHPRNIKDWQIREIAERGGLVGVTFVGKFLGEGRRSSEDIFRRPEIRGEPVLLRNGFLGNGRSAGRGFRLCLCGRTCGAVYKSGVRQTRHKKDFSR